MFVRVVISFVLCLCVAGCGDDADGTELTAPIVVADTTAASPLAIVGGGFTRVAHDGDATSGHQRWSSPPGSGCMAEVRWWRPSAPTTGGPMEAASERDVTVAGEANRVITTRMFEGAAREVDVVFVRGEGFDARIVFESCGTLEEDTFLAGVSLGG